MIVRDSEGRAQLEMGVREPDARSWLYTRGTREASSGREYLNASVWTWRLSPPHGEP